MPGWKHQTRKVKKIFAFVQVWPTFYVECLSGCLSESQHLLWLRRVFGHSNPPACIFSSGAAFFTRGRSFLVIFGHPARKCFSPTPPQQISGVWVSPFLPFPRLTRWWFWFILTLNKKSNITHFSCTWTLLLLIYDFFYCYFIRLHTFNFWI